ncbi:MAG: translation initiation factor IF-2 N-terminal domain-containing protein [bacterium]|nr:translation initiation factor IF-2 N-terminal domain-containing protein [bacterium]
MVTKREILRIIKEVDEKISNKIKGGKADKLTVEDIADKFSVPVKDIQSQLKMGEKVEMEHVDDKSVAREIALDHLSEFPDYYSRLNKMEKEAKKEWKG